jgi:hypothetical protein
MPANDITTICNEALARIGAGRIQSIEDANQEGRYCTQFFETTRDEVLRDHPWNFARELATLSRLTETPSFKWTFYYQLPVDCLRVIQVNGHLDTEDRPPWEIIGRKLATDEETAEVAYTKRVEDGLLFDALFVEALAVKLASKLARPLTGSATIGGELMKEYESAIIPKARRHDGHEKRDRRKQNYIESDLVRARFGHFG